MIRSHRLAVVLGLAVAFLWGMTFLSIKMALQGLSPMTLAFARFVVATLLLPLIALVLGEKLAVRPRDLPLLASGGLVGITLYFFFENNGILLLPASEASLIIGTIPVVTILAERLVFGTKSSLRVYAGVVLSFIGVALIVFRSGDGISSPLGYLCMFGAAVSWVAYSFVTRPLSAKYGLLAVTFWQIFFGMVGCLPFALLEPRPAGGLTLSVWLNVLYLGVFGSAIGYWFYIVVLETLGAAKSSVFINLIPVVAVAAAYLFLGERLNPLQFGGGLIAVTGVFIATASSGKT